jgi:hypothetical protein
MGKVKTGIAAPDSWPFLQTHECYATYARDMRGLHFATRAALSRPLLASHSHRAEPTLTTVSQRLLLGAWLILLMEKLNMFTSWDWISIACVCQAVEPRYFTAVTVCGTLPSNFFVKLFMSRLHIYSASFFTWYPRTQILKYTELLPGCDVRSLALTEHTLFETGWWEEWGM